MGRQVLWEVRADVKGDEMNFAVFYILCVLLFLTYLKVR